MRRVGYQDGGEVAYDESVPQPILRPKPRPEAPDDTIYPTTAPDWGDTGADPYQAAMAVGYARGGPVGAQDGSVQPGVDMNHRAALLAGLRKRYDAMIAMAQGALAHRDENAAVRFAQRAHDMVPDGKSLILHVQPDGNVLAIVHDPRGGEQSRHVMTPDQFHHYLIGPATSFDHVIENGVGHNLGIATGRPMPRTPDHPADPIHKVRQVLQHTRRMFGVDRIGQAPPRIGYAAGGPVRGYDDGGEVDDTLPPDPPWTNQDERDNPPPPDVPADNSIDDYMLNAQRGMASAPAQRDAPTQQEAPATAGSGMGELLARAAKEKWNRNLANAPQSASVPGAVSDAWDSIKQALADYVNGTNAASPEELSQAKQNEANQNPNLSTPEVVQSIIAGPPDPNVSQLPTAEAPAETTAPSTATTDPQERTEGTNNRPAEVPANWATNAGYTPRTGYFTKEGAAQGQPAATGYGQDQGMLPRNPSKEDLRPVGTIKTPDGRFPVNRNGEIIKPDGTLEFTPPNQSQRTVIDPRTGERLEMTGGTGIPIRPREGTPGGTGVRGSLNRPFGLSAKDTAYKQLSASGALDIVPSDKYGRSPEAQAAEGARPWTQDMARPIGAPMPRGAPPMYVTERPAPYYDPNTGQVVTPPRQIMPGSGPPVGVAPGSPEAGKPPAWQPPPNIPGAVGQQPPADDQSPAARAARAFPMASQTRQRVQYQGTLEQQAEKAGLEREGLASKERVAQTQASTRRLPSDYMAELQAKLTSSERNADTRAASAKFRSDVMNDNNIRSNVIRRLNADQQNVLTMYDNDIRSGVRTAPTPEEKQLFDHVLHEANNQGLPLPQLMTPVQPTGAAPAAPAAPAAAAPPAAPARPAPVRGVPETQPRVLSGKSYLWDGTGYKLLAQ
jgi:hypothetical protein